MVSKDKSLNIDIVEVIVRGICKNVEGVRQPESCQSIYKDRKMSPESQPPFSLFRTRSKQQQKQAIAIKRNL